MKYIKAILDFFINSSVHVSLAVVALAFITVIEFDIQNYYELLLLLFFASISGYNFIKYFDLFRYHKSTLTRLFRLIKLLSIVSFVFTVVFLFKFNIQTQFLMFFLAIITFFYAMPFLPNRIKSIRDKNLREITGLKVFIIAFVWGVTVVIIPVLVYSFPLTIEVLLTFLQRFLFVLALMIPFEIRDLAFDNKNLGTLPQKFGINKTKLIGLLLLLVIFLLELVFKDINGRNVVILGVVLMVTSIFILNSNVNQSKYYSAFWVESIPLFWLGLIFVFS